MGTMPKAWRPCQRYDDHGKSMVIPVYYAAGVLLFHGWFCFIYAFHRWLVLVIEKKTKDLIALRSTKVYQGVVVQFPASKESRRDPMDI